MFKDKNFGLPKDLIESARSVMEKKDPIGDKIKELDEGQSGWQTRGVSADGEKGFIKTPEYTGTITDEGPAKRKKFDLEKYKKETEAIQRSPGRFSPDIKLGENHVVKFTFYLKENFHINELTEEEIAWIYENEYVQWLEEQSFFDPIIQAGKDASSVISKGITRLKRGASDIASRAYDAAYDALPDVTDAAKRETQRNREDVESGAQMRDAALNKAVPSAKDAFAKDYDAPSTKPSTPSRPAASARRETGSDSSDPSSSQSFTSYREGLGIRRRDLKTAQSPEYRQAYERYRKAKTPKKSFSQTAYEPGGVFDRD